MQHSDYGRNFHEVSLIARKIHIVEFNFRKAALQNQVPQNNFQGY